MTQNTKECQICYEDIKELIKLHDNHFCCKDCAKNIIESSYELKCPYCRYHILNVENEEINYLIQNTEKPADIEGYIIYCYCYIITLVFFNIKIKPHSNPRKMYKSVGGKCIRFKYVK